VEGKASEATALHRRYPNEIGKKSLVMEGAVDLHVLPVLKHRNLWLQC